MLHRDKTTLTIPHSQRCKKGKINTMSQTLQSITNILLALLLVVLVMATLRIDAIVSYVACSTNPEIAAAGTQSRVDHCRRHLNQGQLP